MDSRHVVIVADCDHQSIDIERAVLAGMSPDLPWLNCRTEDEIIAQCSSAEGLIIMYAPMTRRVLEQLEHCKIIARYGVGVDTIDLKAAADLSAEVSKARAKGYTGDACPNCQSFTMVRNGSCLKCETCGSMRGCS